MNLQIVEGSFSICRLNIESPTPTWALSGVFYSITKTIDELSIVCQSKNIPNGIKAEAGWGLIKVQGPLDFGLTGILASLVNPLAFSNIIIESLAIRFELAPAFKKFIEGKAFIPPSFNNSTMANSI